MSLPQKTLGRTGHSATRLGLGGEGVLRTFDHDRQAQAVIEAALAAGCARCFPERYSGQ